MNPQIPDDLNLHYRAAERGDKFHGSTVCMLIERIATLTSQLRAIKDGKGWFEDTPAGQRKHYYCNDTEELKQASLQHERDQEMIDAECAAHEFCLDSDQAAKLRAELTQLREENARLQKILDEEDSDVGTVLTNLLSAVETQAKTIARLKAPVSDEEWGQRSELEDNQLWRKGFDRTIEDRANPLRDKGQNMSGIASRAKGES